MKKGQFIPIFQHSVKSSFKVELKRLIVQ